MFPKLSSCLKPWTPSWCSTPTMPMPRHRQANCAAMNWITASVRHGFSDNMLPVYRGGVAETMQNSPRLNLHHLLERRHNHFGLGLHGAQGFRMGEALRFFAVDADNLLHVAG